MTIKETGDDPARFPPGTGAAEAKEYIFHFVTALKLTEKSLAEAEDALKKWRERVGFARAKGDEPLAEEAGKEAARRQEQRDRLAGEAAELKAQIAKLRAQVPGLAARERSIDPDVLEQELRIVMGETPGEASPQAAERRFAAAEAENALEALKAKMGLAGSGGAGPENGSPGGET